MNGGNTGRRVLIVGRDGLRPDLFESTLVLLRAGKTADVHRANNGRDS